MLFKTQSEHSKIGSVSTISQGNQVTSAGMLGGECSDLHYYFKAQSIEICHEISSKGPLLCNAGDGFFCEKIQAISQECAALEYRC